MIRTNKNQKNCPMDCLKFFVMLNALKFSKRNYVKIIKHSIENIPKIKYKEGMSPCEKKLLELSEKKKLIQNQNNQNVTKNLRKILEELN